MQDDMFDGEELLALARINIEKGDVEAALGKLKRAVKRGDAPAEATLELARLYAQVGLREKAGPLYEIYLQAAPGDVDALFQHGMVTFEEGDTSAALSIWDDVLRVSPGYPPALYFQGAAYLRNGDVPNALKSLRLAVETLPADNLYFSRARDLISAIEAAPKTPGAEDAVALLASGGKTQH